MKFMINREWNESLWKDSPLNKYHVILSDIFCGYRNSSHETRLLDFFWRFLWVLSLFKVIPILWLLLVFIVVEPKKTNGKKKSKREKTKKSKNKKPKEIDALDIFEKYEGSGFHDNLNQFLDDTLNGNGIDISSTRIVFWPFRKFYAILNFQKNSGVSWPWMIFEKSTRVGNFEMLFEPIKNWYKDR